MNHECSNMVANILLVGRLQPKGHTSTFSEHDHFANQIKGNHECSNMVANILLGLNFISLYKYTIAKITSTKMNSY